MKISYDYSSIDFDDRSLFPLRVKEEVDKYPVILSRGFLSSEERVNLKEKLRILKKKAFLANNIDLSANRMTCTPDADLEKIHQSFNERVSLLLNLKLVPTSISPLIYFKGGHFPPHTDWSHNCEYTLLLPIEQNEPWPAFVEGREYIPVPGDALLYSGLHHVHWRNEIQEGNFSHHVLFFFRSA